MEKWRTRKKVIAGIFAVFTGYMLWFTRLYFRFDEKVFWYTYMGSYEKGGRFEYITLSIWLFPILLFFIVNGCMLDQKRKIKEITIYRYGSRSCYRSVIRWECVKRYFIYFITALFSSLITWHVLHNKYHVKWWKKEVILMAMLLYCVHIFCMMILQTEVFLWKPVWFHSTFWVLGLLEISGVAISAKWYPFSFGSYVKCSDVAKAGYSPLAALGIEALFIILWVLEEKIIAYFVHTKRVKKMLMR